MPGGYIEISAEGFLESPVDFGVEGTWIESSVCWLEDIQIDERPRAHEKG